MSSTPCSMKSVSMVLAMVAVSVSVYGQSTNCTLDGGQPPPNWSQLCASEPLRNQGNIYYYCDCDGAGPNCDAGVDTSSCTNPQAPCRSYNAAQLKFGTMLAGETIAFCRGGRFNAIPPNGSWENYNCTPENPCIIRDYFPPGAVGTEGLPTLFVTPQAVNIPFDFENGGPARFKHGYRVLNLHLSGPRTGVGKAVYVYNPIEDLTLCNLEIEGFRFGIDIDGSTTYPDGGPAFSKRIKVLGSYIHDNVEHGYLGACIDCVVEDSTFDRNGSGGNTTHSIYFQRAHNGIQYYEITGMRASRNRMYHNSPNNVGSCAAPPLVVHGKHSNVCIENNLVQQDVGTSVDTCWGIAVDPGYPDDIDTEYFNNVTIRNNRITNVGNFSIGVSACVQCLIENNLIIQQQSSGSTPSFSASGIVAPDRQKVHAIDPATNYLVIQNNTFLLRNQAGGSGISVGEPGLPPNPLGPPKYVVASNAIMYANGQGGAGSGPWSCLVFDPNLNARADGGVYYSNYNLCWYPVASSNGWWSTTDGGTPVSLSDWQAGTGQDQQSLNRDPLFISASSPFDLRPSQGSPLPGAGDPRYHSTTDISGVTRPNAPAIGAYEYGSPP